MHEVNNPESFFTETFDSLKNKGKLLFSEPSGHVSKKDFNNSLVLAKKTGFEIKQTPGTSRSRYAILEKNL